MCFMAYRVCKKRPNNAVQVLTLVGAQVHTIMYV